ncbi:LexA family transcriptional regulator [Arcobacter sp. FWKO B]|uniref:LexA family transcriptional regulator n=1 Tax=Arcobacter sp. FWKO B TaxID=2593672 RepID=UPI0018A66357|nr:S24 family peptidase [Arcobacter sp. FWKO B]QOG13094.1 phage repressor protein [Arcobacter sp. FWKO B]
MEFSEIIDKLKDIISSEIGNKRVFDKDVATALHISNESLSHLKKRNSIPYEQIAYFCAKRNISINWVLFDQLPKSLEEQTNKYTKIKYFKEISASAGGGSLNFEEDYEYIAFDSIILQSLYKSNKIISDDIVAINVIGDSMYPTLNDKEIILFDKTKKDISKGGIFVVSTLAGLFVKRISRKLDGNIELISDNKNYNSEIFKPYELENINILGKVISKIGVV